MMGGEYKDIEFLEVFENCAQKLMFQWNSKGFQKKFSTLYKVIQITGTAYKKLLLDKFEAEKLKDAEDAKKVKDIKDTSDTKPQVHGKGFAKRPKVDLKPIHGNRWIWIPHINNDAMLESGCVIKGTPGRWPDYPVMKPHRNIRRHRVTK